MPKARALELLGPSIAYGRPKKNWPRGGYVAIDESDKRFVKLDERLTLVCIAVWRWEWRVKRDVPDESHVPESLVSPNKESVANMLRWARELVGVLEDYACVRQYFWKQVRATYPQFKGAKLQAFVNQAGEVFVGPSTLFEVLQREGKEHWLPVK